MYYSFGFVFAYRTLFGRFVFAFDTEYDDERLWFVQIARAIRYKFEREKFQTLFRDFVAYGFADVATTFIIIFPFENMKFVLKALSCVFYWVMVSYLSVMTYIVYFDVEELEREDLKL